MLDSKYDELVNKLRNITNKYANNAKIRNILCEEFIKRNLLASKATNILTGRTKFEELRIDNESNLFVLFVFTLGMQKALSTIDEITKDTLGDISEYSDLVVENYFTELEVINLSDFKLEKREISRYPYIFPNMIQVEEGHWTGITSSSNLASIDAANDITYNFEMQRDPKINVFGFKEINIDENKISKIKVRLLNKLQKPDEIKLNVLKGSGEDDYFNNEVEFIPYTKDGIVGDLIIHSGEIDIFDGYHRKTANSLAIKERPNFQFNWKIAITNWNKNSAQDYMVQINEQKPIKKEHTRSMDKTIMGNLVVNEIKDTRFEFATQIKDSDEELEFEGVTKKSILSTAIDDCYSEYLKTRLYIGDIGKWIAEFMDYLMGQYLKEFFIDVEKQREISYVNSKNMFYGYIALSEKLYKQDDWKNRLKEKMKSIDFDISNPYWKKISFNKNDITKKTKTELYKLFREDV